MRALFLVRDAHPHCRELGAAMLDPNVGEIATARPFAIPVEAPPVASPGAWLPPSGPGPGWVKPL